MNSLIIALIVFAVGVGITILCAYINVKHDKLSGDSDW